MADEEDNSQIYVLTVPTVQWAIEQLRSRRTHPFFPAYLTIRREAAQQGFPAAGVHPHWDYLEQFLAVPGGPPKKPNYRPFWHQSNATGQHFWMNGNLAGSYAPSSIRDVPRKVIDVSGDGSFSLQDAHWKLALDHLLFGEPMSVVALGVFLYRDFGITPIGEPEPIDVVDAFRDDFAYPKTQDPEFGVLFDPEVPNRTSWFEPWTE